MTQRVQRTVSWRLTDILAVHMNRIRICGATVLIGVSLSCAQVRKQLTEAEAIRVAEKFVAENRYTDLPSAQDKTSLSSEGIDASDPEERLRTRQNTLERKAYGVGGGGGEHGWTIVFHYNAKNESYRQVIPNFDQHIEEVGRAVTMSPDGSNIKMQHQDIYLSGLRVIHKR